MTEIHVYASDPAFPEIDRVARWIAALTNPVLFWDVWQMDDLERRALLAELKDVFEELGH